MGYKMVEKLAALILNNYFGIKTTKMCLGCFWFGKQWDHH